VTVEPYLITLTSASDVFPTFQHDGIEMIYMLEGVVGYRHGQRIYRLEPGDTLFFDADAPHGPEELEALADPLPVGDFLCRWTGMSHIAVFHDG
jgi:uncharacterized RmlC-like cupin family protein